MRLRRWVQVVLLIAVIGLFLYAGYAFARMENSIEIDIFHFIALIIDMPVIFILCLILGSDYCTILKDIENKLTK